MRAILLGVLVVLLIVLVGSLGGRARREKATPPERSLYDRLGGVYGIASVVDDFSDAVLASPVVGVGSANPQLREWSRLRSADRLPGLKDMRTLWLSDAAGGPVRFHGTHPHGADRLNLEAAHRHLRITPREFDEMARILGETLDRHGVPAAEKLQVMSAFYAHKLEVTAGSKKLS